MTGYPAPGLAGAPQTMAPQTWVAIDVAKDAHVVLVEAPTGRRRRLAAYPGVVSSATRTDPPTVTRERWRGSRERFAHRSL